MGLTLKAPWDWCPDTYTDPVTGGKCELKDTSIDIFALLYIRYTCSYLCPGGAAPVLVTHTRNRVLGIFDF